MFLLSSIGLNVARTIRTAAASSNNLLNSSNNGSRRMISSTFVKYQAAETPSSSSPSTTSSTTSSTNHIKDNATHKPTDMDKRYLVWSGKYKSASEIPEYIQPEVMERAHNKVRIRGANIMMALTVVGCILMVMSGKNAAKSGDSVQKQNLDWHKQYNQDQQPSTNQTQSK